MYFMVHCLLCKAVKNQRFISCGGTLQWEDYLVMVMLMKMMVVPTMLHKSWWWCCCCWWRRWCRFWWWWWCWWNRWLFVFLSNGVKIKMALGVRNNLVQPNPCLLANERKWKIFFEWDFSVSIIGLKLLEGLLVPCGQESCSWNQLRIEQRTIFLLYIIFY